MIDFGLAFTFLFQDQDWVKKVVLAAVIMLIPILGQIAVLGWTVALARRVIAGEAHPLPDWDDFGAHIMDGLKATAIGIIYSLPILVTIFPVSLMGALFDTGDEFTVFEALALCCGCFAMLYGLLFTFAWPAALGELAATSDLGAALSPGKIVARLQAAPGPYIVVFLGSIVSSILASFGVLLCIIGLIVTAIYPYIVQGHMSGQAYQLSEAARS